MQALIQAADGRYRSLVAVCLFAGLRISETLGLTWDDVDFESGLLRVHSQLNRKGERVRLKTATARRDVVMMDALAGLLRRHRLASPHSGPRDPVFSTSSGTSMSARNAGRALSRIASAVGLTHVSPHVLRHTFASLLIAQGRDPVFVADQLGHSSPAITLRVYAHLFRAAKQADDARSDLQAAYGALLHPPP